MATSILNILIEAQRDWLIQKLITEVSDTTKAGLVQSGIFHDDVSDTVINIFVHPGNDKWRHEMNTGGPGYQVPTFEMGGGDCIASYRRRFRIELKMMLDQDVRDDARTIAQVVLSRAENALMHMPIPAGTDSFCESVVSPCQVISSYMFETGDIGQYYWRGEILTEWLTERNC